jgi:hypothetical protein
MPYGIRKVRGKKCFTVYNKENKRVFAKCTTKKRALKQINLLRAIQYNKSFVPRNVTRKKRTRK